VNFGLEVRKNIYIFITLQYSMYDLEYGLEYKQINLMIGMRVIRSMKSGI